MPTLLPNRHHGGQVIEFAGQAMQHQYPLKWSSTPAEDLAPAEDIAIALIADSNNKVVVIARRQDNQALVL